MRTPGGIRASLPAVGAGAARPLAISGTPAPGGQRIRLVAGAAASAGVIVTTLSIGGFSWLNLDSLLEHPLPFHALLTLPTALAFVCLALAILPRTLFINLAVFAGLIGAAEAGAWALAPAPSATHGERETFYARHAALGYVLVPSVVAHHPRGDGSTQSSSVTYEIDDRGRRRTPTPSRPARSSFVLFFGDSNTFGEGLGQTDTLPYYAGQLAADHRPYNYGVPGYGPQHMLELLNVRRIPDEVPEPEGHAVYFFIPAHVARAIGSSKVSTGWGRHFPYYRLGPDGGVLTSGDFVHGRPLTTLLYHFWNESNLAAASGVDLPPRYWDEHYRLTAKILAESGRRLARQVPLQGFHVILAQAYNAPQREVLDRMRAALTREGVPVLDYSRLLDASDPRYRLSDVDYHNSAAANRAMATQLVSDLRIAR